MPKSIRDHRYACCRSWSSAGARSEVRDGFSTRSSRYSWYLDRRDKRLEGRVRLLCRWNAGNSLGRGRRYSRIEPATTAVCSPLQRIRLQEEGADNRDLDEASHARLRFSTGTSSTNRRPSCSPRLRRHRPVSVASTCSCFPLQLCFRNTRPQTQTFIS